MHAIIWQYHAGIALITTLGTVIGTRNFLGPPKNNGETNNQIAPFWPMASSTTFSKCPMYKDTLYLLSGISTNSPTIVKIFSINSEWGQFFHGVID